MTQFRKYFWATIGGMLAVVAATLFLMLPTGTHAAATNPTGTYLTANNDFYAYVQSSENLNVSFVKQIDGSAAGDGDAVITVSRPGASDVNCTVLAADPVSTACTFTGLTATQSGIWHINFAHAQVINDYYSWTIGVKTGSTDIPGRVWSSVYNVAQQGGTPPTGVDFLTWYQSQFGYLYKTTNYDYNGISSAIQADALGLVQSGGGCIPLYKSVNRNSTSFAFPPGSCNSAYKIFYETPASDLPASATRWDNTTDWIKPAIATPAISNLNFTSTTPNSRAGNITFDLANFSGTVDVSIDTNDNGSYSDPGDVTIPYGAVSGAVSVPFDGNDGNGDPIPISQKLTFKIAIDRSAEIHFLATDVELRGGGIEVQRLNGPAGGENVIHWDDTNFASPDANRCSFTSQLDGTAGVDSTGGVHAWDLSGCGAPNYGNFNNNVNGSWGDSRIINEWAYVSSNTFMTTSLAGYIAPGTLASTDPTTTLAATGQNANILTDVGVVLILISGIGLINLRRRTLL